MSLFVSFLSLALPRSVKRSSRTQAFDPGCVALSPRNRSFMVASRFLLSFDVCVFFFFLSLSLAVACAYFLMFYFVPPGVIETKSDVYCFLLFCCAFNVNVAWPLDKSLYIFSLYSKRAL